MNSSINAASVIKDYHAQERRAHELRRTLDEVVNAHRGGVATQDEVNVARQRFETAKDHLKNLEPAFKAATAAPPTPTKAAQAEAIGASRAQLDIVRREDAQLRQQHQRLQEAVAEAEQDLKRAEAAFASERRATLGRGAPAVPDPRPAAEAKLGALRDDLAAVERAKHAVTQEQLAAAEALREAERSLAAMEEEATLRRIASVVAALQDDLSTVLAARTFTNPRIGVLPSTERVFNELGLNVTPQGPGRWRLEFNAASATADGKTWLDGLLAQGGAS